MSASSYNQLRSAEAASELTKAAGNFHDAFIKELHLLTMQHVETFLTQEGGRFCATIPGRIDFPGNGGYNLRLLLVCLWPAPRALELVFVDVQDLLLEGLEAAGSGLLEYERTAGWEHPRITFQIDDCRIVCLRLLYRWLDDMPAEAPLLGDWIPTRAEAVIEVEDECVSCPLCGEGWVADPMKSVRCPKCGEVFPRSTELPD